MELTLAKYQVLQSLGDVEDARNVLKPQESALRVERLTTTDAERSNSMRFCCAAAAGTRGVVHPIVPGLELTHLLGTGGMGSVYAAVDDASGTEYAVKILQSGTCNAASRTRFEREATAMLRLVHDNVCRAYRFGETEDGSLFLVLERLKGRDLAERLHQRRRLPISVCLDIAIQVALGLQAAHSAGLIHRDVKPSNIFLHESAAGDVVKLLDFGLAVFTEPMQRDARVTRTGEVLGTPAFMAPEQARGDRTEDVRTDIWGLGALIYQMVAGQPPFGRGSVVEVMIRLLSDNPTPLEALRPDVPEELARLVLTMLQRNPDERPQSMQRVRAALVRLACEVPVEASDITETVARTVDPLPDDYRVLSILLAHDVSDPAIIQRAIHKNGGDLHVRERRTARVQARVGAGDEAVRAVRTAVSVSSSCKAVAVATKHEMLVTVCMEGKRLKGGGLIGYRAAGLLLDEETRVRIRNRLHLDDVDTEDGTYVLPDRKSVFGRDVELGDLLTRCRRCWAGMSLPGH